MTIIWTLKFHNFVTEQFINETFATSTPHNEQFTKLLAIAYTEGEISGIM